MEKHPTYFPLNFQAMCIYERYQIVISLRSQQIYSNNLKKNFKSFQDYHSDHMVQIGRGPSNGMSFDLKKPPGHVAHHMDLSAHSALSHYTSQMGMKAAMVEASRYGGHVGQGPPTPSAAGAPPRSTITDFFGKMMSFSSCQTPVLPTYYQNAMYSTEKLESHL